jgi:hypothetical protein
MDEITGEILSRPSCDPFVGIIRDYWDIFVNKYGRVNVDIQVASDENCVDSQKYDGPSIKGEIDRFSSMGKLFSYIKSITKLDEVDLRYPVFMFKVWFPRVIIKSDAEGSNSSHEIRDLMLCFPFKKGQYEKSSTPEEYAKAYAFFNRFFANRATLRDDEYWYNYNHSHTEPSHRNHRWSRCCIGNTVLGDALLLQSTGDHSPDNMTIILEWVDKWLVTESESGGAYLKYKNIYNIDHSKRSPGYGERQKTKLLNFLKANPGLLKIFPVITDNKLELKAHLDMPSIIERYPLDENDSTRSVNRWTGEAMSKRTVNVPDRQPQMAYQWENETREVEFYRINSEINDEDVIKIVNPDMIETLMNLIITQINLPRRYI